MKRVELRKSNVLRVTDLSDSDIIGVRWDSDVFGLLKRLNDKRYAFINIGHNNGYNDIIIEESIQSLVERCKHDIRELVVFDNTREFLNWGLKGF